MRAGDPDFMHIAHERTHAGRQGVALQQGIAKRSRRAGFKQPCLSPAAGLDPPGTHPSGALPGIDGSPSGSVRVRPLGQPPAVNDGVTELFPLQSWASPVPFLSPELPRYSPCSPSSLFP